MSHLARIIGSFRLLKQRATQLGHGGLGIYARTGEASAVAMAGTVRDASHKAETGALSIAEDIGAMLKDGAIDLEELRRLRAVAARANRVANDCHTIGEAVT